MLDLVDRLTGFLEGLLPSPWLWAVVLVVSALDALLPFMPSDTTVLVVGVLVVPDPVRLVLLIVIAAVGAFAGDLLSYLIGRRSGTALVARLTSGERGQLRHDWVRARLRRHGVLLIMVSRYVPAARAATMLTAGALGYPYRRFLLTEIGAVTIWAAFFALIGYAGGASFQHHPAIGMLVAFGIAVILGVLIELGRRLVGRHRSGRPASSSPARLDAIPVAARSYSAVRDAR